MANYSVAEAKDQLPKLLNAVERGEDVKITRRGKLVAELRAIETGPGDADEPEIGSTLWLLAELEKVRSKQPMQPVNGASIVRAMRDETGEWA